MVEPVSITLAAIGTVAAVVSALGTIHAYNVVREQRHQDQDAATQLQDARELSHLVNRLSVRLGHKFAIELGKDGQYPNPPNSKHGATDLIIQSRFSKIFSTFEKISELCMITTKL